MTEQQAISNAVTRFRLNIRSYDIPGKLRYPSVFVKQQFISDVFAISKHLYKNARISLEYCDDPAIRSAARRGLQRNAVVTAYRIMKVQIAARLISLAEVIVGGLFVAAFAAVLAKLEHMPTALLKTGAGVAIALMISGNIGDLVPDEMRQATKVITALVLVSSGVLLIDPTLQRGPWYTLTHHVRPGIVTSISYVLVTASITLIVIVLGSVLLSLILAGIAEDPNNKYTTVDLIGGLVYILYRLDKHPALIRDLKFKSQLASDIEVEATFLQNRVPQSLALTDLSAKSEFQDKCRNAATALRAIQTTIAVNGESAIEGIKRTVAQYIVAIATGNYALLPDADAPSLEEYKKELHTDIVKSLASGFAPLTLVIIAHHLDPAFSGVYNSMAIVVALLWAVMSGLPLIDPRFKAKVAELQRVVSTFRQKSE
jgi:hypothetical protein